MNLGGWKERQNAELEFQKLYEEQYSGLNRFACSLLKSKRPGQPVEGRAEVAVQETFVSAWENWDKVLMCDPPAGWLYKALRYKVKEIFKEEYRWTKLLLRFESLYCEPTEEHISLETEFEGIISQDEFCLLSRIYLDGYSYEELSREMGIPLPTLASRIHRIKAKIREAIEK